MISRKNRGLQTVYSLNINYIILYTMMWMLYMLWLVFAHDLLRVQIHGWRHVKLVFFVLFNMVHGFENVCESTVQTVVWIIIEQVKALKKVQQELVTTKKKWRNRRQKEFLTIFIWECLNSKKSSQLLPLCVIPASPLQETHSCAKCFCNYSALSKWRHWKTFHRNCIQKINKKRRSRDKK